MARALVEAGRSDVNQVLLDRPEAKEISRRHLAEARTILRDAEHLVPDVLSGTLAFGTAYTKACDLRRRAAQVAIRRTAKKRSSPPMRLPTPPSLTANDLVEYRGERLPLATWAARRGDSTPFPLIAQLRAGMSLAEALAKGPR
jgi:hypothetical protein